MSIASGCGPNGLEEINSTKLLLPRVCLCFLSVGLWLMLEVLLYFRYWFKFKERRLIPARVLTEDLDLRACDPWHRFRWLLWHVTRFSSVHSLKMAVCSLCAESFLPGDYRHSYLRQHSLRRMREYLDCLDTWDQSCIVDSGDPTVHSCWAGGISCLLSEPGYKVQVWLEQDSVSCLFSYCGTALQGKHRMHSASYASLWYVPKLLLFFSKPLRTPR